ncbi:single-stranded DNA-binding protein [Actinomyces vulturis]|uniref:single-stranded DNA-binding protein n=1 Tax=Actinomyces vulturis TaxID=1857645 RepID=UPI000835B128|nr:single-stranded DNA-binding protein [Actinomyces vulturis]
MSNATIIGNLTADPVYKQSSGGKGYALFTIAENIGKDENARANFHNAIVWDGPIGLAKNVCETLKKGNRVIATGSLQTYNKAVNLAKDDGSTEEVNQTLTQLNVYNIGPDLAFQKVQVAKRPKATNDDFDPVASGAIDEPAASKKKKSTAKQPQNMSEEVF